MLDHFVLPLPTNSPSPSSDSLPDEEGKRKSGKRPPSTAERRASHNAVERARRESLNTRFMDLAAILPNMASIKRPSKSAIVVKSLEFVQGVQAREHYLVNQNDALRTEVNELRARLGMAPLTNSPISSTPTRPSSSVGSSGNESPSPLLSSFDVSPVAPTGFNFGTAFGSPYPVPATPVPEKAATPKPALFTPREPAPVDVNYLMALSLQQQQQQQHHFLGMQQQQHPQQHVASSYAAVAPWLMQHSGPAPVVAGGDSSWLFH